MKLAAIDFETANRSMASVCAVGVATKEEDVIHSDAFYSLIHLEDNVNTFEPFNISIHHITKQMCSEAPCWAELYDDLLDSLKGGIVCAHNANFDMTCLKQTCLNTGVPVPRLHYFDTVELSRHVFPQMPHHRLDDMCSYLDIELNHHHAGSDAYGCLMIVERIMEIKGIDDVEELLQKTNTHVRLLRP
jgi:DNA polymerase-3 subunit epsilon